MRASGSSFVNVDHMVGAELLGDLQAGAILRRAGDDDQRGAGLLADHGLGQALLARPLDQHGGIVADAAVEQGPLDAVRHRRDQSGQFRRDALGNMMQDGIPRQVDVLGKAAPQMGRLFGRRVAVADGVGVVAPVSVFAVAVLAEVAPLALAASDVVLHEHQIALPETLAPCELAAGLGDKADILVAHDDRGAGRRRLVQLDVGPANARHLHLHKRGIFRDFRHRVFADLGLARPGSNGRKDFFHHCASQERSCCGAGTLGPGPKWSSVN